MKLVVVVHDVFKEIGHSNALCEKLDNSNLNSISEIHFICFTHDTPEKLLPNTTIPVFFHKPPVSNLKPFLLKEAFFHIYSFLIIFFKFRKNSIVLSTGTASIISDIVDIQFVHSQFKDIFFSYRKLKPLELIYKKTLFAYFCFIEKFVFNHKRHYLVLADFVLDDLRKNYQIPNQKLHLIYSSVNLERFGYQKSNREQLFNELKEKYPELKDCDPSQPLFLFVGAYERKGLGVVYRELKKLGRVQIIVIGSPEKGSNIVAPKNVKEFRIRFSRDLPKFYNLCDHFLFPTQYEPFGLVILEAAASGMLVSTTKQSVGASEILEDLEGVSLYEDQDHFQITSPYLISHEQRENFYQERLKRFDEYSWEKAGKQLDQVLNQIITS
ncbi:MAG: glycosyltransferase family 4 protein [Bacteriovoracaceae bacterium]